jgi:hypothetical protein
MNKNSEAFLDDVNTAYALQDLQSKFNETLNETKSLKGQKAIKSLMDEQLKNLR